MNGKQMVKSLGGRLRELRWHASLDEPAAGGSGRRNLLKKSFEGHRVGLTCCSATEASRQSRRVRDHVWGEEGDPTLRPCTLCGNKNHLL